MRGTKAKRLRRENPEPKVPHYTEPFMVNIKGKETHVPRRERRAVYRHYIKMLKNGKISLQDLAEQKGDDDRTK